MLKIFTLLSTFAISGSFLFGAGLAGYYETHKPKGEGKQSIVEIFEKNGKYYGYGFAHSDGSKSLKDVNNPDEKLRSRDLTGTIFLYDVVDDGNGKYSGGYIYNFVVGKTYYLTIKDEGKDTITLTGSIDKSGFLNKKYIWKRLSDEEVKKWLPLKPTDMDAVWKTLPKKLD